MNDAQIDQMLAKGGLALAMALSHTPLMQDYARRKMEAECEDARLAAVMGCYEKAPADAFHYAREARACIGSERAYWAAAEGHPFMLPWRGPT